MGLEYFYKHAGSVIGKEIKAQDKGLMNIGSSFGTILGSKRGISSLVTINGTPFSKDT